MSALFRPKCVVNSHEIIGNIYVVVRRIVRILLPYILQLSCRQWILATVPTESATASDMWHCINPAVVASLSRAGNEPETESSLPPSNSVLQRPVIDWVFLLSLHRAFEIPGSIIQTNQQRLWNKPSPITRRRANIHKRIYRPIDQYSKQTNKPTVFRD
jgi:hypothetical protein